jgi:hypothetical protein
MITLREKNPRTYKERLRAIVQEYIDASKPWPATARSIARWAYENGKWTPQRSAAITKCAHDLSRAMREEYITDAQGRRVRAKHAATILQGEVQLTLWADIRAAPPDHMEIAFQQRRQQIVGDCKQLKIDVDSYNENNAAGAQIQMCLNFENDVAEALMTEYEYEDGFTRRLRTKKPR